ncbi:MAG: hypothetical protein QF614_05750, partial [SAR324 cluster bacterium]|nr:hypothetical protein [SAR324 cluster bacterium]
RVNRSVSSQFTFVQHHNFCFSGEQNRNRRQIQGLSAPPHSSHRHMGFKTPTLKDDPCAPADSDNLFLKSGQLGRSFQQSSGNLGRF